MVRIRLRRMGAKKKPFYRIVIADKRSPRNGRFIETVGVYDPCTEPATVEMKHERVIHWLSVGAQPSDAVARLLRNLSLIDEQGKLQRPAEAQEGTAPVEMAEGAAVEAAPTA